MENLRLALRAIALKENDTGFHSFDSGVDFSVGFVDNAVDGDVDADIDVDDVGLIDTGFGVNNIVDEEEEEEEEMQGVELRTPAPLDSLSLTIVDLLKSLTFCAPSLQALCLNGCPMAFELPSGVDEASATRSRC